MKQYKVKVYNSAHLCIRSIYYFCKYKFGTVYAKKIRDDIRREIKKLIYFPESNPIYTISNDTVFRKRIVNRRYIIVFRVYFNYVYVYYVYDGRMNIKENSLIRVN